MELKLTSSAFKEMDFLPTKYTSYGEDVSPELVLERIDPNGKTIAMVLDDMDHPTQPGFNHSLAWNMPIMDIIPEHLPKGRKNEKPFHIEQGFAYGWFRYKGPRTPKGETHVYRYTVYVLDTELKLGLFANKKAMLKAMEGHVLQQAELNVRFQKDWDL